jgi:hypothetical protein
VGQKEALLLFFTLSHVDLGHLVVLLLATFLGPVAFLATVGAHIVAAHLALAFSPRLATFVLATATISATMTNPRARSGPILGLHAGHPLLLREVQTTTSLLGRGRLLALLDGTQVADDFLDRERVEIEQGLHGDHYLLELLRDDMEHLLDQLLVRDVIIEDVQLAGDGVETQREVFNNLTVLERDVSELTSKSLGIGFLDSIDAYVHLSNRFPSCKCRGPHR